MHHYITTNIRPVIKWFYQAEQPEFFTSYHKKGGSLHQCVEDTVETISDEGQFFVVEENGCMAAFFVKTVHEKGAVMEGFHILPPFRNALFMAQFWDLVRREFAQDIYIGIHSANEPALKHLRRNGFAPIKEIEYENKMFTLLTNKLSDKCH